MMTRRHLLATASLALSLAGLIAGTGCNSSGGGSGQAASGAAGATGATAATEGGKKLVVAWAEWQPAKQMETLVQDFTRETGIAVEVQQMPWSSFETKVKTAWSAQDPTFDLIIGDSQWLGKGATAGHYVELTDWAKANVPIADIAPAALKNYGEYPAGSGRLYALPCMSDATVFAYRKDLFEDPANKSAFQAKYGHALAPPKTWEELRQIAEFFTQPDKNLYGAALYYSKEYDGVTMGFDQVLWAFGGSLSDPSGKKIDGVLNDANGVKALEFYADLRKYTPTGSQGYYFAECLRAFQEGRVAMAQSWFAFLPDLTDPAKNKFKDNTGYFPVPAGPAGRFVSLGGQGISISSYSKNPDAAKTFLAWFETEETQTKWAKLGGLTANRKVAATNAFKNATPYNAVFTASVPYLKDFYNTPNYSELMNESQKDLNAAVAGAVPAKEALDTLARAQQKIVDSTGGGG